MSVVMMSSMVAAAALGVSFALMYPTMMKKASRGLASPYAKVEVRRRMHAATTDGLIVASIFIVALQRESILLGAAAAAFLLLRDTINGQSPGKLFVGLTVISLETGRPASLKAAAVRNLVFVIPGANIAAMFLEARTLARDPKGHRLGDRVALTQVVDGFGAKDLAKGFQDFIRGVWAQLGISVGRRRREPARDRAASSVVNYKA